MNSRQRKRGGPSRRRPLPELSTLIEIHQAVQDGTTLHAGQRLWLADLLAAVMGDVDVRERFYETKRGAPPDQERAFGCALWIADRVLRGGKVGETQRQAVVALSMTESQVDGAWKGHRKEALRIAGNLNRATLTAVIHRAFDVGE